MRACSRGCEADLGTRGAMGEPGDYRLVGHNTSLNVRGMGVALVKVERARKKTRDFMNMTR